ncbi:MAG: aminotransferase class I/II-fold pyridoxal phosphate-dependent enzyme [Planctomycetota bacterium]
MRAHETGSEPPRCRGQPRRGERCGRVSGVEPWATRQRLSGDVRRDHANCWVPCTGIGPWGALGVERMVLGMARILKGIGNESGFAAPRVTSIGGAGDGPAAHVARCATRCAHAGAGTGDGAPLATPIVATSTFCRDGVGSTARHQYSRVSNPTVTALEDALAGLEDAGGAVAFASGLAAETALFLGLLRSGDHVVCGRGVYGGTTRLLDQVLRGCGVGSTFVDATDLGAVAAAVRPNTRLIFIETPSNPTLELTDIEGCARIARRAGALLAVDNTFQTPVLQRPLDFGADISVYSTTKFYEGHSAALGGALVTRDDGRGDVLERLRFIRKCTGAIQNPHAAADTIRGIKTLAIRLATQSQTAATVAGWLSGGLSGRDGVERVCHPGVAQGETQQGIAARQHHRASEGLHGAVVTFEVAGGIAGARAFCASLELCRVAEHVGSVETLVTHPATMTHADVAPADRERAGISDGLLRLSVGLEDPGAIIEDIQRGLSAAAASFEREAVRHGVA